MGSPDLVSVHGGHSGEFCSHATDSLQEIVAAYIKKGFAWVGITEHMPPLDNRHRYPEEIAQGLSSRELQQRFENYITTCRRLQKSCASDIILLVGFESEAYSGGAGFVLDLVRRFRPDYVVGSVHHVRDIGFDTSAENYGLAAAAVGGIESLYCRYFDLQYEFLSEVRPQVVGHFDLIRIHDPAYETHLSLPAVRKRVRRNLELMRSLDMIMDVNVRSIAKGAAEPYPTRSILELAIEMGIAVVPGDDSHGVDSVGLHIDRTIATLREMGADTNWRRPSIG